MGEWLEELKNTIGLIFIISGICLIFPSIFYLLTSKELII